MGADGYRWVLKSVVLSSVALQGCCLLVSTLSNPLLNYKHSRQVAGK